MVTHIEAEQRKQAIKHAFSDTLSHEQVRQAINLWNESFYDSPLFVSKIPLFVNQLKEFIPLNSGDQFKLANNLARSFTMLKNELKQKNNSVQNTTSKVEFSKSFIPKLETHHDEHLAMEDKYIIFNAILQETIHYILQNLPNKMSHFKKSILQGLTQLNLPSQSYQELKACCQSLDNTKVIMIREHFSQDQMITFIDFIYEELCDLFGAEQADSIFSMIIKKCDNLPAAKKFSPHLLF